MQLAVAARASRRSRSSSGIEARLIEAEAQLKAGNAAASLATLNAAARDRHGARRRSPTRAPTRRAWTSSSASARSRCSDADTAWATCAASSGSTAGPPNTVFPTGAWHKGGNYGSDVNFPIPQAEQNNPNVPIGEGCLDRNA